MSSKIKNDNQARDLFGYAASFGKLQNGAAYEINGLTPEELIDTIRDKEAKEELLRLHVERMINGRKRMTPIEEKPYKRVTLLVDKAQLEKLKRLRVLSLKFEKDLIYEAFEDLFQKYDYIFEKYKDFEK